MSLGKTAAELIERQRAHAAECTIPRTMTTELHDLSIAELSRLIAARKLSPVELTEALIQRVEQHDGQTRAFITRTFDLAGQQAKQAEAEPIPSSEEARRAAMRIRHWTGN